MEKLKRFITEMRFEFKVLSIITIILLLSIPYSIIKKKFFPPDNNTAQISSLHGGGAGVSGQSLSDMQATNTDTSKEQPSTISEAVNSDRPIIIDETATEDSSNVNNDFSEIMTEQPDIKHMEVATQVENPTVWIYTLNDGLRKDDLAKNYCTVLHNKGIMASIVTVYDERGRKEGRLIELGSAKCL